MARRVALITGAASGIGRATALALNNAEGAFKVVATDVNADNLATLVNEAPDIRAEVMDVKKYEDVEIVIPGVASSEGGLHVLINNAGIFPVGPVELLAEEWHRLAMEVNYFGTARCTRMALPYMRDAAEGIVPHRPHIVNVSSTAGLIAVPFADAYCASKFAVEGLTEAMATTLPQTGIDVSLVEPGATSTHLTRTMQLTVQELLDEHNDQYAEMVRMFWPIFEESLKPEHGTQTPGEIADVIKGVVLREKKSLQHLRHITSKRAKRLAAHKLTDLNGDKTIAAVLDFVENVYHVSRDFKSASREAPEAGVA